jgi:hypothetical protein
MSATLRDELHRHNLVAWCEVCAHYVPDAVPYATRSAAAAADPGALPAADGACDVLYPITPHRRAAMVEVPDGTPIFFCKMFEAR